VSELTDVDGLRLVAYASESENGETETWLDFARDCENLSKSDHAMLTEKCREVGAMLGSMINAPTSFVLKSSDL
jgi:four helix bundle protein